LLTLVAAVATIWFCVRTIKLYGVNTTEGRLWFKLIAMIITITIGLGLSAILPQKFNPFAIGATAGFVLIIWGILERIQSAGIKPTKRDYLFGIIVLGAMDVLIALILFKFKDEGLESLRASDHFLEIIVILLAYIATFLCILMARQMGGHISQGWFYLAFGAAMFSITYTMVTVLRAMGFYETHLWIEAFQILALNAVTFSAFYQRRRHLAMIKHFI